MSMSNKDFTQLTITSPTVISGGKKNEKIVYADIVKNGKKGVYFNLKSCTPAFKPALAKFNESNIYVYIKYNEDLETILLNVLEGMDRDSDLTLKEKFLIISTLEKYKEEGFIKAKVDKNRFGASFFQQPIKGRNG